jgi:hypothetical protein
VWLVAPGRLLIADFGVDWRSVKSSTQRDPVLSAWIQDFESDDSYSLRILGYTDCVGTENRNIALREGRAVRVGRLLGPGARSRVSQVGAAPAAEFVAGNDTVAARATTRAVVIEFSSEYSFPAESVTASGCTSSALPASAADLSEYVSLVLCVEHALPTYTPRQILSLLRQLYYSAQSWSRCRGAGCQFWRDAIPCGLALPDPSTALGPVLMRALRASQVVGGVDIGHVFTGLEAMLCPRADVELEVPGPNWTVGMTNEEFATWGGDLGSAAAQKVRDEADLGLAPRPWSHYIGGAGTLASDSDLEGDIDSYAMRRGLTSTGCGRSFGPRITTLGGPVSQILADYYFATATPVGAARADRFACVAQGLGGRVVGNRIVNKRASSVRDPVAARVYEFAEAFYKLKWHHGYFASAGIGAWLLSKSFAVTDEFFDWLEARL